MKEIPALESRRVRTHPVSSIDVPAAEASEAMSEAIGVPVGMGLIPLFGVLERGSVTPQYLPVRLSLPIRGPVRARMAANRLLTGGA